MVCRMHPASGRAKFSNIDLLEKYNYIGLKNICSGNVTSFDFDLLFNEFPEHILPYDYDNTLLPNVS